MTGNTTGIIYMNLAMSSYDNYPTTGIFMHPTGPNLDFDIKNEINDLSSWYSTTGAAGDILSVSVGSATGISNVSMTLKYVKM